MRISGDSGSPLQVLVVDDNEDAALSLLMLLELEDISAGTAPDAAAAIEKVKDGPPALMLIDIGLPGMNGFELARHLRSLESMRNTTLIALTGRDVAGSDETEAAAFDQFWTKPFDPKKLLAEVKAVLANTAAARAAS